MHRKFSPGQNHKYSSFSALFFLTYSWSVNMRQTSNNVEVCVHKHFIIIFRMCHCVYLWMDVCVCVSEHVNEQSSLIFSVGCVVCSCCASPIPGTSDQTISHCLLVSAATRRQRRDGFAMSWLCSNEQCCYPVSDLSDATGEK